MDHVINAQQESEGLVAAFCHEDDGVVPSGVFSLGPGGDEAAGGRLAMPLHQQLMEGLQVPGSEQGLSQELSGVLGRREGLEAM